ncbi:hypothetical protein J7L65_02945 [Candidatus Bathyarchaeota archaeon]|nr:hypothetical protein [Candidatus Bathyarchaeota archaeon]
MRAEPNPGARRAYTLLFLLISEIVEQLGTDGALEAIERAVEREAELLARELQGSLSASNPLERGLEAYGELMGSIGARFEVVEREENRFTIRVDYCPYYEALIDASIDCGYFLGGVCRNIVRPLLEAVLKQLDDRLRLEVEAVREAAEGVCILRLRLDSNT